MATVNFPCAHCKNLVGVEEKLLGTQVQCPHCQEVVQAPLLAAATPVPSDAAPPCEPNFSSVARDEQESIFAEAGHGDDALFGSGPSPQIEMPAPPAQSQFQTKVLPPDPVSEAAFPGPPPAQQVSIPAPTSEETTPSSAPEPASEELSAPPASEPAAHFPVIQSSAPESEKGSDPLNAGGLTPFRSDAEEAPFSTEAFATVTRKPAALPGMRGGLFIALVLVPLISYSVLATIAVVILYLRPGQPHPLEMLPDPEGELKGAKREKQGAVSIERVSPDSELPANLYVALGHTLRLGDLEVIPQEIELSRVKITHLGFPPEPSVDTSLVLHLRLRNVSHDVVFSPTDPYFDRRWKRLVDGSKPYSFLEFGMRRLYGGPLAWEPGRSSQTRDTIEGQVYQSLQPGEETQTLVCTDPEDHVSYFLANYHGPLVWRVQLRRGLVRVREQEVSATAVVGVQFREHDIKK